RGVERIIRAAFEYAAQNQRKRVHMADKSNALPQSHGLWRRVFAEVARDFPEIEAKTIYIDTLCFELIRAPENFEVIVTNNLFGDIVTDLGAALQGGLGMAASANLRVDNRWSHVRARCQALFEPVHGSAPDIAGKGIANPFATVLSVAMMLGHFGFGAEEAMLVEGVREAIENGICTPDLGGHYGTREIAQWLEEWLRRSLSK
ncbi:MAG: isocitrate/isopropylmalate family dehydrogenase, partial [Deltaproteobacteria bacterium]|nr:isocitrate/isopropylmalate family dehydrogenase [Deltaproteobacteria bacterium]